MFGTAGTVIGTLPIVFTGSQGRNMWAARPVTIPSTKLRLISRTG